MSKESRQFCPSVLVVDEDENIISAFKDFFRREGFMMIAARSVAEARNRIEMERVNLLIVDLTTSKKTAKVFIRDVTSGKQATPVIIITGLPEVIHDPEISALGVGFVLVKPLELRKLRDAVRSLVPQREIGSQ